MSPTRIWLCRIFSILVGFILVGVVEALLHLVPGLNPQPLVITLAEKEDAAVRSINPLYPAIYFFQHHKGQRLARGHMAPRPFVEPSALPTYRVAVVGASTVQGFPHPRRLAAAAFLEAMLQDALPNRQVEVFNLGITSIASFAVAQTLADVLPLIRPDAVVVYTGHNEFYGIYGSHREHRTHLYNTLHHNLMRWRIPQLLGGLVDALRLGGVSSRNLLESLGERGEVPLASRRRRLAREDLETNLRRAVALCRASETPLVLCTLVSNDVGFAPAASGSPPLTGASLGQWQTWVDSAATVLTASEVTSIKGGLAALERAAALWSDSAWLWYLQGRALSQLEKPQQAFAAFVRARNLDTMPWRAPSAHNEVIRSLADAEDILLADVEQAFRHASPPQGIGWELMSDHVHPSVDGQILMARTMLRTLRPLLGEQPTSWEKIRSDASYRTALGDLPVERVTLQRTVATLLSKPPMARYNAHNARLFHNLAATGWQALSVAEQRGIEQWTQDPTEVSLVLEVADQLFAADAFARAEVHYAAARHQAPFTLRGDLWAAVRWAWTLQLQREEFTPTHKQELQLALVRANFLAQGKSASQSTPILNYIRGQLHYFLQQHKRALPYLEAAFHVEKFRRQFIDTLFPVLAAELFYADRADEARRLARLVSDEEGGNPHYIQLVEVLSRDVNQTPSP